MLILWKLCLKNERNNKRFQNLTPPISKPHSTHLKTSPHLSQNLTPLTSEPHSTYLKTSSHPPQNLTPPTTESHSTYLKTPLHLPQNPTPPTSETHSTHLRIGPESTKIHLSSWNCSDGVDLVQKVALNV